MTIRTKLLALCGVSLLLAAVLCLRYGVLSEAAVLLRILCGRTLADSSTYMERAWEVVHNHVPLYQTLFFQQHYKFIYPTSSLLLVSAAHLLHLPVDGLVEGLILSSALLTLYFAGDCFLLLCPRETTAPASTQSMLPTRLMVAFLGLLFYPLTLGTAIGQIQTVLTLLFTLAVWFWIRERKAAAGAAIALICIFKPPLTLFLLWAVLRRQWRFLASLAAITVFAQVLSGFLYGWRNEFDYAAVLAYLSRHGEIIGDNQSVNGLLERWLGNGDPVVWTATSPYPPFNLVVYLGTLVSSAVLLGFAFLAPRLRAAEATVSDFLLFGLASTMASPIVWTHHYAFFFIGCVYVFAVCFEQGRRIPLSFLVAFFVLTSRCITPDHLPDKLRAVVSSADLFAGLVVLAWIALLPRGREARAD